MLIEERIKVRWHSANREHYESLGYIFTKYKDEFEINNYNLPKGSHEKVQIKCDYCHEINFVVFKDYKYQNQKSGLNTDCCRKCAKIKRAESNMVNYGVKYTSGLPEVQEKRKQTTLEKYGVEYYAQTPEYSEKVRQTSIEKYGVNHYTQTEWYKEKLKRTMLETYGVENYTQTEEYIEKKTATNIQKYGVPHVAQNEDIQAKTKQTNLERFGVEHPLQNAEVLAKVQSTNIEKYGEITPSKNKDVQEKMKQTNLERYGVENVMMSPEIRKKAADTLIENNNVPTSSQQKHLHQLLGGELNHFIGRSFLDIAFPDEKIYVEYDGGGHNLSVKLNRMTQQEFDKKEQRRSFFLKDNGWREIRIISDEDKLPSDSIIIDFVDIVKHFINSGKWFSAHWNIDEDFVKVNYTHTYSFADFLTKYNIKEVV